MSYQRIMGRFQYMDIFNNTMLSLTRNDMSDDFIFQNDNDSKHVAQILKQFF